MSSTVLPDPMQMATSAEDIAAIFGGEALVIEGAGITLVISSSGEVLWKTEGLEATPEMIAKIIANLLVFNSSALEAAIKKIRKQCMDVDKISKPFQSLNNETRGNGGKNKPGYSR